VCRRAPAHAAEALECLGGNGITTDWPLEMRYREQPVMAVWEGSGNVIALDVLRAIAREPESLAAFDAEVSTVRGADARFDVHLMHTRTLIAELEDDPMPELAARRLVEALALTLSASQLLRTAPAEVAEGFIAARLGGVPGLFGALPRGVDSAAIAARA